VKCATYVIFVTSLALLSLASHAAPRPSIKWIAIPHSQLCVTEGSIAEDSDQRLTVDVTKMRAFVTVPTTQDIEAKFTYRGRSKTETSLGSGAIRRQFGLKLRAQDPCNLVYAMWRFEPKAELVVSVKSNPSQHTSAECGNRGYENVKPTRYLHVPPMSPGSTHKLRAGMDGEHLQVSADDNLVWEGLVGSLAMSFYGPVGIRSDNVKLEFELRAGQSGDMRPDHQLACKPGSGESE